MKTKDEIYIIKNKIDKWFSYILDDFEHQGNRLDDDDTLKDFIRDFLKIRDVRNDLINIKSEIRKESKSSSSEAAFIEFSDIFTSYNKLDQLLLKKYKEDNFSNYTMEYKFDIYLNFGFYVKGISSEFLSIPEGFDLALIDEDAQGYAYRLYKKAVKKADFDLVYKQFEDVKNEILQKLLIYEESRNIVYNAYLYKQTNKIYSKNPDNQFKLDLDNMPLYQWQQDAFSVWEDKTFKGTFEVATGCGKTRFSLYCIQRLKECNEIKVRIIVPTIAIMINWYDKLILDLHLSTDMIARKGDGYNEESSEVTIYVDKTAQSEKKGLVRDYIMLKFENKYSNTNYVNFVIADECHHYESSYNIKMFNKLKQQNMNYFALGLSATLPRDFEMGKLKNYLGDNIYSYNFMNALLDDIISPINIVDIEYELTIDEQKKYFIYKQEFEKAEHELSNIVNKNYELNASKGLAIMAFEYMKKYKDILYILETKKQEFAEVYGEDRGKVEYDNWINEFSGDTIEAVSAMKNYISKYERLKRLLLSAEDREKRCIDIIKKHICDKVIVFSEYIEDITKLYNELVTEFGDDKIKLHHSNMDKGNKQHILNLLKEKDSLVVCVPTVFDEGVDVPGMSIGIVYQGKRSHRQQIQRLGRIVRKAEDKKSATMYHLFGPKYGEKKFLEYFIAKQVLDIQDIDSNKLKLLNDRLKLKCIKASEQ